MDIDTPFQQFYKDRVIEFIKRCIKYDTGLDEIEEIDDIEVNFSSFIDDTFRQAAYSVYPLLTQSLDNEPDIKNFFLNNELEPELNKDADPKEVYEKLSSSSKLLLYIKRRSLDDSTRELDRILIEFELKKHYPQLKNDRELRYRVADRVNDESPEDINPLIKEEYDTLFDDIEMNDDVKAWMKEEASSYSVVITHKEAQKLANLKYNPVDSDNKLDDADAKKKKFEYVFYKTIAEPNYIKKVIGERKILPMDFKHLTEYLKKLQENETLSKRSQQSLFEKHARQYIDQVEDKIQRSLETCDWLKSFWDNVCATTVRPDNNKINSYFEKLLLSDDATETDGNTAAQIAYTLFTTNCFDLKADQLIKNWFSKNNPDNGHECLVCTMEVISSIVKKQLYKEEGKLEISIFSYLARLRTLALPGNDEFAAHVVEIRRRLIKNIFTKIDDNSAVYNVCWLKLRESTRINAFNENGEKECSRQYDSLSKDLTGCTCKKNPTPIIPVYYVE